MKKFLILLFCLLLTACESARMTAELQQGKFTFASGDYHKSFRQLLPLAIDGEREAQYAVGYMYYNGLGVSADPLTGIAWMEKSAEQHYQPGMQAVEALRR